MSNLNIYKLKHGSNRPLVAVPITGSDADSIVDQCEAAFDMGCDVLEWRVDYYLKNIENLQEQIENETVHLEIIRILDDIDYVTDGMPVIFTIRSEAQGGVITLNKTDVYDLQSLAAQSELVAFVDVELLDENDQLDEVAFVEQIKTIQSFDVLTIASYHDFQNAPSEVQVINLVEVMRSYGADICKIAVTVSSKDEAVGLLKASAEVTKGEQNPVIILGMGKEGMITRIIGGKYGSCITFASGEKATAPGQININQMKMLLDKYYGDK